MKHLYLYFPLLFTLCAAGTVSAQMLPDSTVQVVAYWDVGDKMDYTYIERKYEMDAEGNETQVSSSSETFHFEVVAATDNTYTLEIRCDDLFDTDLLFKLTPEERARLKNEVPYRIKTTDLGTYLALENLDEITAEVRDGLPVIARAAWRNLEPEQRESISEKQLESYLMTTLASPEALSRLCTEEVSPLFFYHGARLDTTKTYVFSQPYQNIIGNGSTTLESSFRVDPELTDDYSVVIRKTTRGDEELVPLVRDYLFELVRNAAPDAVPDYDAFIKELEEDLRENPITASFEEFITEEIHLDSGWPIQWLFDRYVEFSQGDDYQGIHVLREIRLEE